MNPNSNAVPRPSHGVILPCSPEQFSNFIGGLLGKPQTITQSLRGAFEVTSENLINIHHLINQRITQQNGGELLQFTARIIFADDSSVLLNDLDDLLNYNEVRPVVSQQVHLSWLYLIRFNNREFPEKQTIDVSFITDGVLVSFDEATVMRSLLRRNAGNVTFRIQHTARTWGSDIQALLDGHLHGLLTPESAVKEMARIHNNKIQTLTFAAILASTLYSIYVSSLHLLSSRKVELLTLVRGKGSVDVKLNGILTAIYDDPWKIFLLYSFGYFVIAFIVGIFAVMWMDSAITRSKPSFVLLTPVSLKYKKARLSDYRKQWYSFFGSMVISIVTGIISSVIYAKFWGA
jgi:hypothetical protein